MPTQQLTSKQLEGILKAAREANQSVMDEISKLVNARLGLSLGADNEDEVADSASEYFDGWIYSRTAKRLLTGEPCFPIEYNSTIQAVNGYIRFLLTKGCITQEQVDEDAEVIRQIKPEIARMITGATFAISELLAFYSMDKSNEFIWKWINFAVEVAESKQLSVIELFGKIDGYDELIRKLYPSRDDFAQAINLFFATDDFKLYQTKMIEPIVKAKAEIHGWSENQAEAVMRELVRQSQTYYQVFAITAKEIMMAKMTRIYG